MYCISRNVLYSVGPGLTRPSFIIRLFFFLAIDLRYSSGGCLHMTTSVVETQPALLNLMVVY